MASSKVRGSLAALLLLAALTPGPASDDDFGAIPAALAEDDECVAEGSEEGCALNAAQLRASKIAAEAKWAQVQKHQRDDEAEDPEMRSMFADFQQNYGRSYDGGEAEKRYGAFKANVKEINKLNKLNGEPVFGVSYNTDFFPHEHPAKGLLSVDPRKLPLKSVVDWLPLGAGPNMTGLPPALNWRVTQVVTPVKNQGLCGACWAFSAAETIESMFILWGSGIEGYPQTFSTQQLASCVPDASGCGGGNPINAYIYLVNSSVGLTQEVFWPFQGGFVPADACEEKYCTKSCKTHDWTLNKKYQHIIGPYAVVKDAVFATPYCDPDAAHCDSQDLHQLAQSLYMFGPLSIAVNAKKWYNYKSGVLTMAGCGGNKFDDLDHAVQLVGFNASAKMPYWIVRNQWSTIWGEKGFIYLEYGQNTCGLANMATIPILEGMPSPPDGSALLEAGARRHSRYQKYLSQALGHS